MGQVVEIRSYNLKPGTRDRFHQLFVREALPMLQRRKVDVVAYGPSLHDSDSYYLMRAFGGVEDRQRSEDAFYGSDEWRQGPREAILADIESYTTVVIRLDEATLGGLRRIGGGRPTGAPQTPSLPDGAEALSLLGTPLVSRPPAPDTLKRLEANLADARAAYEKAPDDPEAVIWLGRRTAYLGRYRDAVAIFSKGIERHPRYAKLYRHRGHRLITLRQFDAAIQDLSRAAELVAGTPDEIEPDGAPNARNIPTSTSHSNIYYHLGLARYLAGDFDGALTAYRECLKYSKNPDMLTATSHWLYMTLRRLGREEDARAVLEPISPKMEIIENGSYHQLLLMYQGVTTPDALLSEAAAGLDETTVGYGVANWHLYNGRRDQAIALLTQIVSGEQWPAFGHIAAEADLKRLHPLPRP